MAARSVKRRATDPSGEEYDDRDLGDRGETKRTVNPAVNGGVPEIKEAKNIRFRFYPADRRCRPVDESYDYRVERKVYDTLRDCVTNHPTVDTSPFADELQRLISGWVPSNVNPRGDYGELYLADRDREETKDLVRYYRNGQYDVVIALLEAGYGVNNLAPLLRELVSSESVSAIFFVSVTPEQRRGNKIIIDFLLAHPKWLQNVDGYDRMQLLKLLLQSMRKDVERKRATEDEFKALTRLLLDNLFPLVPEDVSLLTLVNAIPIDRRELIDSFLKIASRSAYNYSIVIRGLLDYALNACRVDHSRLADDQLLQAIATSDNKDLQRIQPELKLKSAWYVLNTIYGGNDERYRTQIDKLKESIAALMTQGAGRCIQPSDIPTTRTWEDRTDRLGVPYLRLGKDIVRPFVRRYNPADPDSHTGDINDQVRMLLDDSNDEDIKGLIDLVSRVDLRIKSNHDLLQTIVDTCASGALGTSDTRDGCAVLMPVVRTRLSE